MEKIHRFRWVAGLAGLRFEFHLSVVPDMAYVEGRAEAQETAAKVDCGEGSKAGTYSQGPHLNDSGGRTRFGRGQVNKEGSVMVRVALFCLAAVAAVASSGCAERTHAELVERKSVPSQVFEKLLRQYPDLTFEQLSERIAPPKYLEKLSFDPSQAKFYERVTEQLQLTDEEREKLGRNGFVLVDHDQRYTFGSMYYAIYTRDLPVLVTTDSVLHAMHATYDELLQELEATFFTAAIDDALAKSHEALPAAKAEFSGMQRNLEDVDLYLTVARNLLIGAGAPSLSGPPPRVDTDFWNGQLLMSSKFGQDDKVLEILNLVQSKKLQLPGNDKLTSIYGGERAIDYSQFQPRGHYLKSPALARYFRAMMWLGRADTGWNVLPPDAESGIESDSARELRDAALLTHMLQKSGGIGPLKQVSDIVDFFVGESDNLTAFQLRDLMAQKGIASPRDLSSSETLDVLQGALRKGDLGTQQIRSQVVMSDPEDLYQVPPPSCFQLFGQRFTIDSFVLSKVVFDSIIFQGNKIERWMPSGLDAMFALGNDAALPLQKDEIAKYPYAANLLASRELVGKLNPDVWQRNLYNVWLDALRSLNADLAAEKNLPETMRTEAWRRKQLQSQLASWSELRHNTILYAKQSYTSGAKCEYPSGFVEPYPETYARIKFFADEAARRIGAAEFTLENRDLSKMKKKQLDFLKQMGETLTQLESLAKKELAAEPFNDEERQWFKGLIDAGHMSGGPRYDGWYCRLYYNPYNCGEWDPTVIDVHTDPNSKSVLEVGVGGCNFLIAAIDNESDRMVYVGPAYSYYEFTNPAEQRLTDLQWQKILEGKDVPPRPEWMAPITGPKQKRELGR
jgi:hypothetical protein